MRGNNRWPNSRQTRKRWLIKFRIWKVRTSMWSHGISSGRWYNKSCTGLERGLNLDYFLAKKVTSKGRPENSLLEAELEYDKTNRVAPAITIETTEELEMVCVSIYIAPSFILMSLRCFYHLLQGHQEKNRRKTVGWSSAKVSTPSVIVPFSLPPLTFPLPPSLLLVFVVCLVWRVPSDEDASRSKVLSLFTLCLE